MKTFHASDIRRRVLAIGLVIAAWFAVVAGRLVQLQIIDHGYYRDVIQKQNQDERAVPARRGNIYDRDGRILASSLPVFSVGIRPLDKETAAEERARLLALKRALGLTDNEVAAALSALRARRSYTYVKKRIPENLKPGVLKLKLKGVEIEDGHIRTYPLGRLAAHILGGVDAEEKGRAGVERFYNVQLAGQPGRQIVSIDSRRREYETQVIEAPLPGADIILTIDADIQYILERELAKAVADHSAAWGTVIVMSPGSGEILAMASFPDFDLNESSRPSEAWMNRAIQHSYEPGSTFKIVTAAAALEKGVVSYGDFFDCRSGSITQGGLTIRDHERMGILSFSDVLIHSSNVGTVKFATRLAMADLYASIRKFGFGEKTGLDLSSEEPGRVWPIARWNKLSSVPHIAIGYELMVTPLQILRAMNVFATGGFLVRPHVVRETAGGGKAAPRAAAADVVGPAPRVLDAAIVSGLVERAFAKVVEEGTGTAGRMDEFPVAGKTGTAQVYEKTLGYTAGKHIASFVGFVPVDRPVLTMIVVLADPKEGFYYGGQVCAPVFRDIAARVLRYLRVKPERTPPARKIVTASLQGKDRT